MSDPRTLAGRPVLACALRASRPESRQTGGPAAARTGQPATPFIAAELRRDPTRTTVLRAEYMRAFGRRFRRIKALVQESVVDNDALRLLGLSAPSAQQAQPARDFGAGDAAKVAAFMAWLRGAIDEEILEVQARAGAQVERHAGWQRTFVVAAYLRGLASADAGIERLGIDVSLGLMQGRPELAITAPPHTRAIDLLLQRNFTELQGVTEAMAQAIQRELLAGIEQGLNPRKVARNINDRVDKIGLHRARLIARTETIRAHAEGTLTRLEQLGIEEVTAQVEFSTAGDDRVCERCEGLEGKVYKIEDARGVLPVHPNCRCAWLPVVAGVVGNWRIYEERCNLNASNAALKTLSALARRWALVS